MRVSLEIEQNEQRRWKLRPRHARSTAFDELVVNEFLSEEERTLRREKRLSAILRFSALHVPYYRNLFERIELKIGAARRPS